MPGTIQVSVLGLMGPPPPGEASSTSPSEGGVGGLVSLKIAMGKTEYQTGDKGDFSFPLTSLRENLKLTLLDADGNEISRTDVKTMIVVEKKIWDALFPMEGGGCVHLKLEFKLNAEEHKRICEMREAVLKRRHGKLPKSDFKDSVAENIVGSSANFITEEGHLADGLLANTEDRRGKRLVASLSQDPPEQPEHHHEQDAIHQSLANEEASGCLVNQNDTHEINISLEETMDPQLGSSGSVVSEEISGTSSSHFEMAQQERKVSTSKEPAHEKFPVSNTKKLISAFESISVQEPRLRVGPTAEPRMRKEREGSLGIPWSEEMNTEKVTIQKIIPKSFSTGALPQMKSAPFGLSHAEMQEGEKYTRPAISEKNMGTSKQSVKSKNVQNYKKLDPGNEKAASKFLSAMESSSHERTSGTPEINETKEVVNFCTSADVIKNVDQCPFPEAKEVPPITFQLRHREHEPLEEKKGRGLFPEGVSLDSEPLHEKSDATASHSFEKEWNMLGYKDHLLHKINNESDKTVEGPSVCGECLGGYLESLDGRELVHTNEIRKDAEASPEDSVISWKAVAEPGIMEQLSSSSMNQEQQKPSIVKAASGFSSGRDHVYELTTCRSSDVKLDVLAYFDAEQCLLGSHGDSVPRHLCITSGSKQLKDIIGGFISI